MIIIPGSLAPPISTVSQCGKAHYIRRWWSVGAQLVMRVASADVYVFGRCCKLSPKLHSMTVASYSEALTSARAQYVARTLFYLFGPLQEVLRRRI